MVSGIFTRKAGELIFHKKIQQSSIDFTRLNIIKRSNRSIMKSLLLVLEKSHNLVLSCAMATSNPTHKQTENAKRKIEEKIGKERANKTTKVKWGRGKRDANNVMRRRWVCDGYFVCLDLSKDLPGNGARNPSCYVLSLRWFSLKRKGWCSNSSVSISLSFWEPRYRSSRRPCTSPSYLHKTIATRNQRD